MAKMKSWHVYSECEKHLCEICVENSRWALDNNLDALLNAVKGSCGCWWPFREAVLGLWCVGKHKKDFIFCTFISCIFISLPLLNHLCLGGWDLPASEENLEVTTSFSLSIWGLQGELGFHPSPSSCKGGDSTLQWAITACAASFSWTVAGS